MCAPGCIILIFIVQVMRVIILQNISFISIFCVAVFKKIHSRRTTTQIMYLLSRDASALVALYSHIIKRTKMMKVMKTTPQAFEEYFIFCNLISRKSIKNFISIPYTICRRRKRYLFKNKLHRKPFFRDDVYMIVYL